MSAPSTTNIKRAELYVALPSESVSTQPEPLQTGKALDKIREQYLHTPPRTAIAQREAPALSHIPSSSSSIEHKLVLRSLVMALASPASGEKKQAFFKSIRQENASLKKCGKECISAYPFDITKFSAFIMQLKTLFRLLRTDSTSNTDIENTLLHRTYSESVEALQNYMPNRINELLQDELLDKKDKLAQIRACLLYGISLVGLLEVEYSFGGELPYHNIDHSSGVAQNTFLLMEGSDETLRALAFCSACNHDRSMRYDLNTFSRKSSTMDSGSEGSSRKKTVRDLSEIIKACKKAYGLDIMNLLCECEEESLVTPLMLDIIKKQIDGTVPNLSEFGSLGTISNAGEIIPIPVGIAVSELEGRNPKDFRFSDEDIEEKMKARVMTLVEGFRKEPQTIETIVEEIKCCAVPIADLGKSISDPIISIEKEAPALWAEMLPNDEHLKTLLEYDENPALFMEDEEAISRLRAAKDSYLKFTGNLTDIAKGKYQGQAIFALGRALIMEERTYFPLKAALYYLQELIDKQQGTVLESSKSPAGKNPAGWTLEQTESYFSQIRTITQNIEKLYSAEKRTSCCVGEVLEINRSGAQIANDEYISLKSLALDDFAKTLMARLRERTRSETIPVGHSRRDSICQQNLQCTRTGILPPRNLLTTPHTKKTRSFSYFPRASEKTERASRALATIILSLDSIERDTALLSKAPQEQQLALRIARSAEDVKQRVKTLYAHDDDSKSLSPIGEGVDSSDDDDDDDDDVAVMFIR